MTGGLTANGVRAVPRHSPELPDIAESRLPGYGFTRRVVRRVMALLAITGSLALAVMAIVRVNITVSGSGLLEPSNVWPVRSSEGGLIASIRVRAGDSVQAGQIVAALDTLELGAHLRELELKYESAALESERAEAAAPLELRRERAHLAQTEATLIDARAMLRQRMAEYGVEGSVDSLLAKYIPGHHTTLDLAVGDVLSAKAGYESQRAAVELQGLNRFDR
ncbi:MAG: biotin/lipoyl-binding protein, partial [Woeseiaceae bacterium]